ncbi:MAG: ribosome biogenesis GTPase Der [Elusimicrobia bacterium]|nr:ribosome biogenesis GTPase Der [Candidatus Liberimonas magnetica]
MNNIIAIVGRPNVGKSTLFNRMIGKKKALVHDIPGTTRDYTEMQVSWDGKNFNILDTGGWGDENDLEFSKEIKKQMEAALSLADIVVFVVDAKNGLHPYDVLLNNFLRMQKKKIILAINKIDTQKEETKALDFYSLGIDEPVMISANHGRNINELLDKITGSLSSNPSIPSFDSSKSIHITLIGKPNVGKSTLFNKLYKKERSIVSPKPGTTREAIDIVIERDGQNYVLIDTPGLHKKRNFKTDLDYLSSLSAARALERTNVAVMIVDAEQGITETESKIGEYITENRCACLVAINKWDLIEGREDAVKAVYEQIEQKLKFMPWAKVIFISAKTGQRVERIFDEVKDIYKEYSRTIAPEELRKVIQETQLKKSLSHRGEALKTKSITQTGVCPPTFKFKMNNPEILHFSHKRFFENTLRKMFGFTGTPITLRFSKE